MSAFNPGGAPDRKTVSMQNRANSGLAAVAGLSVKNNANARQVASGALVATVFKQLLLIYGKADLDFLSVYTFGLAQTITVSVEVDGLEIFNGSVLTTAVSEEGMTIVGDASTAGSSQGIPIVSESSIVVNVKSSVSDTNKVFLAYKLRGIE